MKKLLAGAVVSTLLGAPASAADMAPAPVYQPPAPLVARLTWTGCYAGANGGGLLVRNDNTFAAPVYSSSPALGASLGGHDASGWLAGVQMGCNYHWLHVVLPISEARQIHRAG